MNSRQLKVGILGCTGLVGQRLIETLDSHPVFKVSKLFGREEKRGELYFDVVNWACSSRLDPNVASMEICSVDDFPAYEGLNLLFSAFPADVALNIEGKLRNAGYGVISNAKSFRLDVEVPLLVPEIDIKSLELIDEQKKKYGGGFIATNPNCSVIGISLALGPIEKSLGIKSIQVVTMQAMSGAGLNGLSSKEFMANLVPNILGEEEKIMEELPRVFSRDDIDIKVRVNRVPVVDGHTFNIWFRTIKETTTRELIELWKCFEPECGSLYSISNAISNAKGIYNIYENDNFMPQPKLDAWHHKGMITSIGRIEALSKNEFCITVVSNNIARGAAGGTLIIAETLYEKGLISF